MPTLGLFELIFIGVFFILMVIGTALDRRYNESPKWWILGVAFVVVLIYFWSKTDFTSVWTAVISLEFWKPFGIYLGAGLLYSVLEFILSVRKMQRKHETAWRSFIDTVETTYTNSAGDTIDHQYVQKDDVGYYVNGGGRSGAQTRASLTRNDVAYRYIFSAALSESATEEQTGAAKKLFKRYCERDGYTTSDLRKDFIQIQLSPTFEVEPVINRSRLASFIGCWTFLWPAYAVSLILGDFLVEVFRVIGDFFSKIGGRFVKLTFADTFKV